MVVPAQPVSANASRAACRMRAARTPRWSRGPGEAGLFAMDLSVGQKFLVALRLGRPYVVQMPSADAAAPDRPWRRPGALRYALHRLHRIIRPTVWVDDVPAGSVVIDNDVTVPVRDGTLLRVNVYR